MVGLTVIEASCKLMAHLSHNTVHVDRYIMLAGEISCIIYAITVCLCRRIVRGQTLESTEVHDPIKCHSKFETWGKNGTNCPEPVFAGNPPMVYHKSQIQSIIYGSLFLPRGKKNPGNFTFNLTILFSHNC